MGSIETRLRAGWLALLVAIIAPGCALAAPPIAVPFRAAPAANPPADPSGAGLRSIRISYRDLDLETPQGIATLYVRIRRAATEVCEAGNPLIGTRIIGESSERCVHNAIATTVKQLGVPGLATLEAEQQALSEAVAATKPLCDRPAQHAKIII
jgi:UrcA family protein